MRRPDWGTTQSARFTPALDPSSVLVDERSIAHFLTFAQKFSKLLNFYGPDETGGAQPQGDWSVFFNADISFLLAEVCNYKVDQALFDTNRLARQLVWDETAERDLIDAIYTRLCCIDDWYLRTQLADNDAMSNNLASTLEALIQPALANVLDFILNNKKWAALWDSRARDATGAAVKWYAQAPWRLTPATAAGEGSFTIDDTLVKQLNAVDAALTQLQGVAQEELQLSLSNKSDHPPHTTLLIALLQLMQYLQNDLNNFTERHLDYYYRSVLQLSERRGQADSVTVMFELAPGFTSWLLPAKSLLMGGKNLVGEDILYATDADIVVQPAKRCSLYRLTLERDNAAPAWVRRALVTLAANTEDGIDAPLKNPALGWPMFSASPRSPSAPFTQDAELGLMITSPVLLLSEGERKVTIKFIIDAANSSAIRTELSRQREQQTANINTLFGEGFKLFVSTAKEWMRVAFKYSQEQSEAQDDIVIDVCFSLGPDQPAMVCNQALAGAPPGPWPCVRLVLNSDASVYQYSSFSNIQLKQVDLNVVVSDLRNLTLSGDLGQIAVDKPFFPFGALGACGAHFDIAHAELGKDNLRDVKISLIWLNLPLAAASFDSYYAYYAPAIILADTFQIQPSVYNGRRWMDQTLQPLYPNQVSTAAITFNNTPLVDATASPSVPCPAPGTLRLALASPQDGFGSAVFPAAFRSQVLLNASAMLKKSTGTPVPLPNPPIAPQVKYISCEYGASDSIVIAESDRGEEFPKLHYLYPFGSCPIQKDAPTFLLADDGCEGRLYIGLKNLTPPQTLSLHFQIREPSATKHVWKRDDAGNATDESVPKPMAAIRWRYLSSDRWHDFPAYAVQSGTQDFTRSGVVRFALPADLNDNNSVMPSGQFWIEVRAAKEALDTLCVDIVPNAVTATRCLVAQDATTLSLMPASIKVLLKKTPAIKKVLQPYASDNGRAAESPSVFRSRISERLKHKQRASQPSDYEQLVLDAFPAVLQAKCITANNSAGFPEGLRIATGTVVIAVTSSATPVDNLEALVIEPAPFTLHTLTDIADSLQPYISEFVGEIHICNPVYEPLKVYVNVLFKADQSDGACIKQLNADISDYLAPWLKNPLVPLNIGCGQVHGHDLARFIRTLAYIERISKVWMAQENITEHGNKFVWIAESDSALALTPLSVFMPVALHQINSGSDLDPQPQTGVGKMTLGENFILGVGGAMPLAVVVAPTASPTYVVAFNRMYASTEDKV